MSSRIIKIATRASPLAMWQSSQVKTLVEKNGYKTEIVQVETSGDEHLNQPAYAFGITGIFTKQLDISLLNDQTDIAVHSLKDVPTELAKYLTLAATLERGSVEDVIILKNSEILKGHSGKATIATGSFRRSAQWLSKYPNHNIVPIRGNVQTRLNKFHEDKNMDGIIFAKAGLERLGILPKNSITLDWMLPAAAQGIIGIMCRENDSEVMELCKKINNTDSYSEASVERAFLNALMGGCSVPIGVKANLRGKKIHFHGVIYDYDGKNSFEIERIFDISETLDIGSIAALEIMKNNGAKKLMEKIRNVNLKKQEYDNV